MAITVGVLVLEIAIFAGCYVVQKRPPNPARPRLIPYSGIMTFLAVVMLATAAHVISLGTGQQVTPRTQKYGNH